MKTSSPSYLLFYVIVGSADYVRYIYKWKFLFFVFVFFAKLIYYNVKDLIPCCVVHIKMQLWTQIIVIVRWGSIVCQILWLWVG